MANLRDFVDALVVRQKPVVVQLGANDQCDEEAGAQADREPADIEEGVKVDPAHASLASLEMRPSSIRTVRVALRRVLQRMRHHDYGASGAADRGQDIHHRGAVF